MSKMKLEVKPSQIVLKEDLNKLGVYKIELNFHSEVSCPNFHKNRQNSISLTFPQIDKISV